MLATGGANLGPLQEAQADAMAATTARNMSLAEKARAEVEAMQRSEAARNDPNLAAVYAGHAAGVDEPTAKRLAAHLRGDLEQPSPADVDDAMTIGKEAQPYVTGAPVMADQARRLFQSHLASTYGNRLATGKTNADQLAKAGGDINSTALTNDAANTESVPAANQIIAAVSGRQRQPFKMGGQGQVLDTETGNVDENTELAQSAAALSGARTTTEGARQTELGSRSTRNTSQAALADERAAAVARGEANKGGARVSPQQVERWVSETARKEWEAIPAKERKGMNFQQHIDKVRERFTGTGGAGGIEADMKDALEAINKGAPAKAVHARFEKRWGKKLIDVAPDPSDSGVGAGENALDEED